jgi:hypothetical protein
MGIHVASAVVYRVPGDSFHGTQIDYRLYKVEVCGLMLLGVPLPYPNHITTISSKASSRPNNIVE